MNDRNSKPGTSLRHYGQARWLWGCLLFVGAAGLGQQPSAPPAKVNPLGSSPQIVAEGRELYGRSCTGCHGLNGAAGERGPALAGERDYVRDTDAAIFAAVHDGIAGTGMPPAGLEPNDIWKIVAYIRSLRASASDAFVPGDVAHGERIFWDRGRCGACHMLNGRGSILGPDLSSVGGERTLAQIRAALTEPRKEIPNGYRPAEVATRSGRRFSGIIKNEDNFSLQLLDDHEQLRLFNRDDLREIHYRDSSLMPAHYDKTLTPVELQDLLAFLSRQARDKIVEREEDKP